MRVNIVGQQLSNPSKQVSESIQVVYDRRTRES